MSGAAIAARVAAGLRRASAATGDGTVLTAQILRTSGANETVYPPVPGTTTSYSCAVLLMDFDSSDREGTDITSEDIKVLVSPDAETDPRNGDRLLLLGETYDVDMVRALRPGGTVLMWTLRARRA